MKFVLQYIAGFTVFASAFVALSITSGWSWVFSVAGVAAILLITVLKFAWDLSGFNGGYSS